jgi:hypothetical protein
MLQQIRPASIVAPALCLPVCVRLPSCLRSPAFQAGWILSAVFPPAWKAGLRKNDYGAIVAFIP